MEEKILTQAEQAAVQFEGLPKLLDKAKDIEKRLKKNESDYPLIGGELLKAYADISDSYTDQNAYRKSLRYLKKALQTSEVMAALNFKTYGKTLYLAKLKFYRFYHEIAKNDKKADEYLFEALETYEKWCETVPEHYPDLIALYEHFVVLAFFDKRRAASFRWREFEIVKKLYQASPDEYAKKYAELCRFVADEYVLRHEEWKAHAILFESLRILQQLAEKEDDEKLQYQLAWVNYEIGNLFIKNSKNAQARPYLTHAVRILEMFYAKQNDVHLLSILVSAVESLGKSYCDEKPKCRECFERAFSLIQKGIESEPKEFTLRLAKSYIRFGETVGDEEYIQKGKALMQSLPDDGLKWLYSD